MMFEIASLAQALKDGCPDVVFAMLHGSAKGGTLHPGSDIDVALYLSVKPAWEHYQAAFDAVCRVIPDVQPDIGILNNAEPIYRFEALKGRLLFCRNQECFLRYFSQTCMDYESQIADYERQHRYRLESASNR